MPFYNIVPHETAPGELEPATRLGDLALLELLSPALSGNWVLGSGFAFIFPTATSEFTGQGKWQLGPSVVVGCVTKEFFVGRVSSAVVVYRRRARSSRYEPDEPATQSRRSSSARAGASILGQYPGEVDRAIRGRLERAHRAVTGLLYVAVLIARLVSLYSSAKPRNS